MESQFPLIAFREVAFAYGPDRPVLSGLSFDFGPVDRIGLVGPNGSGKTTLLHLALGLLKPTAGEIFALGSSRKSEKDFYEVRTKVGLLFQDPDDQLFCPTVIEDVAFGPLNLDHPHDEAVGLAETALERVGAPGLAHRVTTHLSFGEKKIVALAAVLAMEPLALLLDEPSAGLDEAAARRLVGLLNELNLPFIAVSHDEKLLDALACKRLRLADGAIRQ